MVYTHGSKTYSKGIEVKKKNTNNHSDFENKHKSMKSHTLEVTGIIPIIKPFHKPTQVNK